MYTYYIPWELPPPHKTELSIETSVQTDTLIISTFSPNYHTPAAHNINWLLL